MSGSATIFNQEGCTRKKEKEEEEEEEENNSPRLPWSEFMLSRCLSSESRLSLLDEPSELRDAWDELASRVRWATIWRCKRSFSCFSVFISLWRRKRIKLVNDFKLVLDTFWILVRICWWISETIPHPLKNETSKKNTILDHLADDWFLFTKANFQTGKFQTFLLITELVITSSYLHFVHRFFHLIQLMLGGKGF